MPPRLACDDLMQLLSDHFERIPDLRSGSNRRYAVADAVKGAFSVFFMQSPSFLAHQRDMQRLKGQNNAASLFGVSALPSDQQIRNLLDPIAPQYLAGAFWDIYAQLEGGGVLASYRGLANNLLCCLDGVQYFSSPKLHCPQCTVKEQHGEKHYAHSAITPVLVKAGRPQVISLEPEFITPQDGHEKQDCEQAAIKRWLQRNAGRFAPHSVTLLADDLHSHQPTCEVALANHFNFIFTCKPTSHEALSEEIALLEKIGGVQQMTFRHFNGRFFEWWVCRYAEQVPLRAGADALHLNWCEVTITHSTTHQPLYHNAFITNHPIDDQTLKPILDAGRTRWKAENENNNVLKNYGYHLEHNYGHGQQFLAALLVSLNLLAFLCHTVLDLTCELYQRLRKELATRKTFFDDLRTLTRYFHFANWQHLFHFMAQGLELIFDSG